MMLVGLETARYCGCRILHEIAMGTVVLRIHPGVVPDEPARGEPVQFMLTGADLDELIDHLKEIRASMRDSEAAALRCIQGGRK